MLEGAVLSLFGTSLYVAGLADASAQSAAVPSVTKTEK